MFCTYGWKVLSSFHHELYTSFFATHCHSSKRGRHCRAQKHFSPSRASLDITKDSHFLASFIKAKSVVGFTARACSRVLFLLKHTCRVLFPTTQQFHSIDANSVWSQYLLMKQVSASKFVCLSNHLSRQTQFFKLPRSHFISFFCGHRVWTLHQELLARSCGHNSDSPASTSIHVSGCRHCHIVCFSG